MASDKVVILSDSGFDSDVLKSDIPVMVDFWAEWCGPCKMLGPTIDQLAGEFHGKVKIAKLNVDENPSSASRFGIRSIPALLIFKDGKVQEQMVGAQPKDKIASALNKYVVAKGPVLVPSAQPAADGLKKLA